jgi:uroporphyrinogen-III synthase
MTGTLPLAGVRVVVTRAERQAEGLSTALGEAGAVVALLPLIEIGPAPDIHLFRLAVALPEHYDWIVFTSANAVAAFCEAVGEPLRPGTFKTAVVGAATASALRDQGLEPDLVASKQDADGLADELIPLVAAVPSQYPRSVFIPQAEDARPTLADRLRAAGIQPVPVAAYTKRIPEGAPGQARKLFGTGRTAPLGWVTFTSPSIVEHFAELFGREWSARRKTLHAASIGPLTTTALREAGVEPAVVAEAPKVEALVAAIVAAVAGGRR